MGAADFYAWFQGISTTMSGQPSQYGQLIGNLAHIVPIHHQSMPFSVGYVHDRDLSMDRRSRVKHAPGVETPHAHGSSHEPAGWIQT